ncbi:right-handed parallel beta-helix repeat-containing protein [Tenacibaculum jejuense]|uniref:Lipoprotein n=1 Tax=Tenacibaculum jejuense TaxID=584609 RepID=A0A238U509_9FLAO|nr:uronase [Tenacibaculum jejuense]SNR14125.1 conserved exported protein of unknown function [Tenacibaculum jejuense]
MKKIIPIILFSLLSLFSCSKDTIEGPIENPIPEEPDISSNTPCDFDLSNAEEGETISIDCSLNLEGKTINLPKAITILFNEGKIENGTLNFTEDGKIDGALLNNSLTIQGDIQLTKNEFDFIPSKWGIVEGVTTNEISRTNRDILENNMTFIKSLGASIFKIDKMDAFFNVDEPDILPSEAAINVPSDFTLKMTNNTHLRMQPNAAIRPTLLATFTASNVTIDGGVLHGDRDSHDYTTINSTHEWGHLLRITGTKNSVFKNIRFEDATGDAIDVHAYGHSFDPHYTYCDNVLITNNIMLRSRRNHISITDGRNITVEKNDFIDASIHTNKSTGIAPGFAIDVEAVRHGNPRGISEIAEDIFIKNNTENGSRVGAVTVHTGDRVTIEGNKFENSISYSTSIGTIIRNNEIIATTYKNINNGTAIVAGRADRYDDNYNGKVYGNTIENYAIGMTVSNKDLEVYANKITNCKTGLRITTIRNAKIYDNIITSSKENSDGIVSHPNLEYMDNVIVGGESKGNTIKVTRTPLKFVNVNEKSGQENFKLIVANNIITSENTSSFSKTHGFEFIENTISQGGVRIVNSENGKINNNSITSTSSNGIRLDTGCKNLTIKDNTINVTGNNLECIKINTTDGININIENNSCN